MYVLCVCVTSEDMCIAIGMYVLLCNLCVVTHIQYVYKKKEKKIKGKYTQFVFEGERKENYLYFTKYFCPIRFHDFDSVRMYRVAIEKSMHSYIFGVFSVFSLFIRNFTKQNI